MEDNVKKALATKDPTQTAQWWGQKGMYRITGGHADVRPGGKWHSEGVGADGTTFRVDGEYLEVDPPRLLVHTWNPSYRSHPKETVVRWELEPRSVHGLQRVRDILQIAVVGNTNVQSLQSTAERRPNLIVRWNRPDQVAQRRRQSAAATPVDERTQARTRSGNRGGGIHKENRHPLVAKHTAVFVRRAFGAARLQPCFQVPNFKLTARHQQARFPVRARNHSRKIFARIESRLPREFVELRQGHTAQQLLIDGSKLTAN